MIFVEYIGRLAPTPSGYLHKGHAATFHTAWQRARDAGGKLLLRIEDIDLTRCRSEYEAAVYEDLSWLGLDWDASPQTDPTLKQSNRFPAYEKIMEQLVAKGYVYPCTLSRKQIAEDPNIQNNVEGEAIILSDKPQSHNAQDFQNQKHINWRFHVEQGQTIEFEDLKQGPQRFEAGKDFGDFLVWRKDGSPSYELAVVVDDIAQCITEVVRGADLLFSTARQLLLYEALSASPPAFYHCPLVVDEHGKRLAKSYDSLSIRTLREQGVTSGGLLRATGARIGFDQTL